MYHCTVPFTYLIYLHPAATVLEPEEKSYIFLFFTYTVTEVIHLKRLKTYTAAGIFFVLILGTLSHFFYKWSGSNFLVGFFTPVNESVWEHMKLLFFPALLCSLILIPGLKKDWPCVTSSLFSGILLGTALMPILFYTCTGILGSHTLPLDIAVFILCVILTFYTSMRLALSCQAQDYTLLLFAAICLLVICFIIFTCFPPDLGLFADPTTLSEIRFYQYKNNGSPLFFQNSVFQLLPFLP